MKILNLYAGIGGNRKLWGDKHEVTAVEIDSSIAKVYQKFFPKDKIVIGDAHEYLLKNYGKFDFIWSSPPCPSHSRINNLKMQQIDNGFKPKFPDMKLYEEIIFLKHWFKGDWVVENVKSYYDPLIKPFESENHYFWSNFHISKLGKRKRGIAHMSHKDSVIFHQKELGIDLSKLEKTQGFKEKVLNNCVHPDLGLHIFKCAFKEKQRRL